MTWASRRRSIIVVILVLVIGGLAFWHYSPVIFKAPSCTDGVKDGTETGIDCGGMCTNLCTDQVNDPIVLWARSFPVTSSVYNAAAYIQNQNDAGIEALPYEFRLYDAKGIFVTRVDGTALVPPLGNYAIVETGIQVGNAVVTHTTFEFGTPTDFWQKIPSSIQGLQALTSKSSFDTSTDIPRLTSTLTNTSPTVGLTNTVVAAILYDANGNAVNVSRTIVPTLAPGASTPIFFTWPQALSAPVVRYDLLPIIDIFHTTH